MDPLSVTTACVSLLGGTLALSKQIHNFVITTRDARKDMDAFSRELASLQLCIESLQHEETVEKFPDGLKRSLAIIIRNCNDIVGQMSSLLNQLSSGSLGRRIQWTFSSRDEAERLRSSLEAHKSAIEISLSISGLAIGASIQADAEIIKQDTSLLPAIKMDTAQISELRTEITALRFQIMQIGQPITQDPNPIERFLDESISYADSIIEEQNMIRREPAPSSWGHVALTEATRASSDTTSIISNPFSDTQIQHYAPSFYSTSTSLSEYWEPLFTPVTTHPLAITPDHHAMEAAHRTRKRFPKWKKDELDQLIVEAVTYAGPDRQSPEQIARTISLLNLGAKITSCDTFSKEKLSSYGTLAKEIYFGARTPVVELLLARGGKLPVQKNFDLNIALQPPPDQATVAEILINQGVLSVEGCLKSAIECLNLPLLDLCLSHGASVASALSLCVKGGWISGLQTIDARTPLTPKPPSTDPKAKSVKSNIHSFRVLGAAIVPFGNEHADAPSLASDHLTTSERFLFRFEDICRPDSALSIDLLKYPAPLRPQLRQHYIDEITRQHLTAFPTFMKVLRRAGVQKIEDALRPKGPWEQHRTSALESHRSRLKDVCWKILKERGYWKDGNAGLGKQNW